MNERIKQTGEEEFTPPFDGHRKLVQILDLNRSFERRASEPASALKEPTTQGIRDYLFLTGHRSTPDKLPDEF